MSVEAMALVLHHSEAKGTDKLILVGIANHDGDGGAWPSIATLAKYARVTERNVQKALARLVELGEVRVHLQDGGRRDTPDHERPNRYDVLVACPPTCDGTTKHRPRKLPQAAADLWTDPLSETTPGVASDTRGVSPVTPTPVSPATPEPSYQPTLTPGSHYVEGPRASVDTTPPCTECSAPNLSTCAARQAKLARADRHTYAPAARP